MKEILEDFERRISNIEIQLTNKPVLLPGVGRTFELPGTLVAGISKPLVANPADRWPTEHQKPRNAAWVLPVAWLAFLLAISELLWILARIVGLPPG